MHFARYIGVLGVSIFLTLAQSPSAAQPSCTLLVQPWQSLQYVIDNVASGSVICLTVGMWTQSISIQDKILTIWGAGRDQTILMSTAGTLPDGITIAGQSIVTVRGLAVYSFRNGVVVNGRSSLALRDVQISGNALYGLQALGLAEATLENSHVSYNLGGVAAWDSAHVTVQYAQIFSNHEDGIWLDFASSGWLLNNIIQGNQRYGVRVYSLENLSVCWRNIVVNNVAGNFYPEMVAQQCH